MPMYYNHSIFNPLFLAMVVNYQGVLDEGENQCESWPTRYWCCVTRDYNTVILSIQSGREYLMKVKTSVKAGPHSIGAA
jgi:hypothetical protein